MGEDPLAKALGGSSLPVSSKGRQTIGQILSKYEGEWGKEIDNLVFAIEENLPVTEVIEDYFSNHFLDTRLIDDKLKEGKVTFAILASDKALDWLHRNLEEIFDFLHTRSQRLQGKSKWRKK